MICDRFMVSEGDIWRAEGRQWLTVHLFHETHVAVSVEGQRVGCYTESVIERRERERDALERTHTLHTHRPQLLLRHTIISQTQNICQRNILLRTNTSGLNVWTQPDLIKNMSTQQTNTRHEEKRRQPYQFNSFMEYNNNSVRVLSYAAVREGDVNRQTPLRTEQGRTRAHMHTHARSHTRAHTLP